MIPVDRFGVDKTRLQVYPSRHIHIAPEKVGVSEITVNRGAVWRCDEAGLQGADSPGILARLEIGIPDGNMGRKIRRIGKWDRLDGLDEEVEERNPDPGDDVFASRLSGFRRILERLPEGEQTAGSVGAGFRAGGQALPEKSGDRYHPVQFVIAAIQIPVALKRRYGCVEVQCRQRPHGVIQQDVFILKKRHLLRHSDSFGSFLVKL